LPLLASVFAFACGGKNAQSAIQGQEGGACMLSKSPQGSCADPSNVCMDWTPPAEQSQLATCILPCKTDADCGRSKIGSVCASVSTGTTACVSSAFGEGERADVSLLHGRPMTGCQLPLEAIHRLDGSLLLDLDFDQASCATPCTADASCSAMSPVCVPITSTVSGAHSICMARHAGKGAKCSLFTATHMCDLGLSPNMICADLGLSNADQMMEQHVGACVELCDMMDMACRAKADTLHTSVCEYGFFSDATLGICDDKCSAFPDDCTGPGSPPLPGDQARGARCIPFRGNGTVDKPDQALCIDVEQHGDLLPVWDFATAPSISCETNTIACPDRTTCIGADPNTGLSVCVYGCSTTQTPNGCDGTGHTMCHPVFGTDQTSGVCE
jgi:hypothetical protein